jgi:two-component system sensor histidine kinase HydH
LESDGVMTKTKTDRLEHLLGRSPWILVGSVVILLVTVLVLAGQGYNREAHYISRILSEKGAALIKTVEAGARTGMRHMRWGDDHIQALIQESALVPEVLYITMIDGTGRIVADSDPERIGASFDRDLDLKADDPPAQIRWTVVTGDDGRRAFEVYKRFVPLSVHWGAMADPGPHPGMHRRWMMMPDEEGMTPGGRAPDEGRVIVVGLDPSAYEAARRTDIRTTLVLSGVLVLLGFGGFVSMYWMQSYRAARRRLQDTSAMADEVMTSLPVGLIATDRQGRLAVYNAAAQRVTGLDLAGAVGRPPEALLPAEVAGLMAELATGRAIIEREMTCEFVPGTPVPVSVSASNIVNEAGDLVGRVLILRDLTEVRRLQEAMRRQEKLAAIGGLAAGMAHEIRNPLSSIKGMASFFKAKFDDDSEGKEAAEVMIQEVDRLNRVISELLDFVRPSDLRLKRADMEALLERSLRLIQPEAASQDIAVERRPSPRPLTVALDADRFTQALLNLYLNALQAMGPGGRLTVTGAPAGEGRARITIEDTGSGIAPEHLGRIFDPYFTTKAKGTGLGLAIARKIIEAHHGELTVESTLGRGTRIAIDLPLHNES